MSMRPRRATAQTSPAELALRYQRLVDSRAELDLDEASLVAVVTYYRRRCMGDEAFAVARRSLAKYPYSTRLYLAKAKVLADLHLYDDALEALERAGTYGPGTPQVTVQRAEVYAAIGRHEDAFAELDGLGEVDDPVLASMRALAESSVFERMGRHDDMYALLERAVRAWPDNDEALHLMWVCTELTGRHADTEALCEWVLRRDPYNAQAWYNLGHACYAQGKTDLALASLDYATLADPRHELAYREAGEICYETGRHERAVEVYETMMEYLTCDDAVMLRLGQCYYHAGALAQARLCVNRVLQHDPAHDEALYYSGLLHGRAGDWPAAVDALRAALEAHGRREDYAAALADALHEAGDLAAAERHYALAAELAPDDGARWVALARFRYGSGRYLEALSALDEAEDYAVDPRLSYCRVVVMIALGREGAALRALAELLQESDASFAAHAVVFEIEPALFEHELVTQVIRCFS